MSRENDSLKSLRSLVEECEKQIAAAKVDMPSSTSAWFFLLLFFLVILFPFIVFPLLSNIQEVKPLLESIEYNKIENVLSKNSVQILFYALPVALVVTHGISMSGWKSTVSEVMKLRLYKLAAIRQLIVLESSEWVADEKLRVLLLDRAFDLNVSSLNVSPSKEPDTGNLSLDAILKVLQRLEKQVPNSTETAPPPKA
jgi:hypothetical protein